MFCDPNITVEQKHGFTESRTKRVRESSRVQKSQNRPHCIIKVSNKNTHTLTGSDQGNDVSSSVSERKAVTDQTELRQTSNFTLESEIPS